MIKENAGELEKKHSKLLLALMIPLILLLSFVAFKIVGVFQTSSVVQTVQAATASRAQTPGPQARPAEPSSRYVLAEAKRLAETPSLLDRYDDDYPEALKRLGGLRAEYVRLTGNTGDFDRDMSPDLVADLEPASLEASSQCGKALSACLVAKVNQPKQLAKLGGRVCENVAYAASLIDNREALRGLQLQLQQANRSSCLNAQIIGLVDGKRDEDLAYILDATKDPAARLDRTQLAIAQLRQVGDPNNTVETLLQDRAQDTGRTDARSGLLQLLAVEGQRELGQKVIGDEGNGSWFEEMETFRRDLAHWNHNDDAKIVQQKIEERHPRGWGRKMLGSPGKVGGWAGRLGGDAGRLAGSALSKSYDFAPSKWDGNKAPLKLGVIDKLDREEQPAALIDILSKDGPTWEGERHEAARRLLALSASPRDDAQTRKMVLQQVRGRRLWAATQLLEEIQDEKLRLETGAQAIVDLKSYDGK